MDDLYYVEPLRAGDRINVRVRGLNAEWGTDSDYDWSDGNPSTGHLYLRAGEGGAQSPIRLTLPADLVIAAYRAIEQRNAERAAFAAMTDAERDAFYEQRRRDSEAIRQATV